MENTIGNKTGTPEEKARFLNQYALIGLQMKCIAKNFQLPDKRFDGVLFNIRGDYALCLSSGNHLDFYDINEWELPLRSIESLNEAECREIQRLFRITDNEAGFKTTWQDIQRTAKDGFYDLSMCDFYGCILDVADYLRSIGILIPFMGYTEAEILSMGWAKIKTT